METTSFNFTVKMTFFDECHCEVNYRELIDEGFSEMITNYIDLVLGYALTYNIAAFGVTDLSGEILGDSNFFIVRAKYNNEKHLENIKKEIKLFFSGRFPNIFDSDDNYIDANFSIIDFVSDNDFLKEPSVE